jgi:uncharacterized membrane protein YeaQ/YmgE (transglycosylase-associated protein family)
MDATRLAGAKALGAGLLCVVVELALEQVGFLAPLLVMLGVVGAVAGATLLIWGDAYKRLEPGQKVLAAVISVMVMAVLIALVQRFGRHR